MGTYRIYLMTRSRMNLYVYWNHSCRITRLVQKSHAANREGSFNIIRHICSNLHKRISKQKATTSLWINSHEYQLKCLFEHHQIMEGLSIEGIILPLFSSTITWLLYDDLVITPTKIHKHPHNVYMVSVIHKDKLLFVYIICLLTSWKCFDLFLLSLVYFTDTDHQRVGAFSNMDINPWSLFTWLLGFYNLMNVIQWSRQVALLVSIFHVL